MRCVSLKFQTPLCLSRKETHLTIRHLQQTQHGSCLFSCSLMSSQLYTEGISITSSSLSYASPPPPRPTPSRYCTGGCRSLLSSRTSAFTSRSVFTTTRPLNHTTRSFSPTLEPAPDAHASPSAAGTPPCVGSSAGLVAPTPLHVTAASRPHPASASRRSRAARGPVGTCCAPPRRAARRRIAGSAAPTAGTPSCPSRPLITLTASRSDPPAVAATSSGTPRSPRPPDPHTATPRPPG